MSAELLAQIVLNPSETLMEKAVDGGSFVGRMWSREGKGCLNAQVHSPK
jgi:hypothetical protein